MTAQSPVCDRSDQGHKDAEQQAPQDVAGPVISQVHTRGHHQRHDTDGEPPRDMGYTDEERGPGDMAAGEHAGERDMDEWHKRDGPRKLLRRQRLGDDRLDGDLDGSDQDDQQWHPGIAPTASQAGDRETERDPACDFCLPQDADEGREEIEPRGSHGLRQVEHSAVDLAQRADCDQG